MNCRNLAIKFLICFCVAVVTIFVQTVTAQETIKIGVVYGFTGAAQVWSDYGRMGLELARDEINAQGGIQGKQLELIFEDSRTNPAQSVSAYRKLVSVDHVPVVIGNVWSFITNPLIPLATADRVILISPTVMDASVEKTSEYFFTMGARIDSISDAVEKFFRLNPEIRKVALFCWEDAWGRAYLDLWKRVAKKAGVEVVDEICQNDFANDFRTDVTRVALKKPDAIIVGMYSDRVLQRMREQGVKAKVLTTSDMVEALRVRKSNAKLLEGAYFTDWRPSEVFIKQFEARFRTAPILEVHNHYEVLRAVAKALETNSSDLLKAFREVHYQGVMGEIDFRSSPFVNYSKGELFQVTSDGKISSP